MFISWRWWNGKRRKAEGKKKKSMMKKKTWIFSITVSSFLPLGLASLFCVLLDVTRERKKMDDDFVFKKKKKSKLPFNSDLLFTRESSPSIATTCCEEANKIFSSDVTKQQKNILSFNLNEKNFFSSLLQRLHSHTLLTRITWIKYADLGQFFYASSKNEWWINTTSPQCDRTQTKRAHWNSSLIRQKLERFFSLQSASLSRNFRCRNNKNKSNEPRLKLVVVNWNRVASANKMWGGKIGSRFNWDFNLHLRHFVTPCN